MEFWGPGGPSVRPPPSKNSPNYPAWQAEYNQAVKNRQRNLNRTRINALPLRRSPAGTFSEAELKAIKNYKNASKKGGKSRSRKNRRSRRSRRSTRKN